jgi:hypothetical protein
MHMVMIVVIHVMMIVLMHVTMIQGRTQKFAKGGARQQKKI